MPKILWSFLNLLRFSSSYRFRAPTWPRRQLATFHVFYQCLYFWGRQRPTTLLDLRHRVSWRRKFHSFKRLTRNLSAKDTTSVSEQNADCQRASGFLFCSWVSLNGRHKKRWTFLHQDGLIGSMWGAFSCGLKGFWQGGSDCLRVFVEEMLASWMYNFIKVYLANLRISDRVNEAIKIKWTVFNNLRIHPLLSTPYYSF